MSLKKTTVDLYNLCDKFKLLSNICIIHLELEDKTYLFFDNNNNYNENLEYYNFGYNVFVILTKDSIEFYVLDKDNNYVEVYKLCLGV